MLKRITSKSVVNTFLSHTLTGPAPHHQEPLRFEFNIDSHHRRLLGVSETTPSLGKFQHTQGRENPIEIGITGLFNLINIIKRLVDD